MPGRWCSAGSGSVAPAAASPCWGFSSRRRPRTSAGSWSTVTASAWTARPWEFVPVMAEGELPENELRRVEVGRVPVLLVRRQGRIFALAETCSHLSGPLAEGRLEGDSVVCPWHGSRFALGDGRVLNGPATHPQPCFAARVRDGRIEVRAGGR